MFIHFTSFLVLSLFSATPSLEEFLRSFIASLERVIVVLSYVQPLGPSVLLGLLLLTRCAVAEPQSQVFVSLVETKWSLGMCWYLHSIIPV